MDDILDYILDVSVLNIEVYRNHSDSTCLTYPLQATDANVAIASDDDVANILQVRVLSRRSK